MVIQPETLGVFEAPKGLSGAFCAVTRAVFDDEPCLYLAERNLLSETGYTRYRYQILKVVRDDRTANAYVCLGKADDYTADELDIPGSIPHGDGKYTLIHTVAELRGIAEDLRQEPPKEVEAPPMQEMWWERADQKERFRTRESTFGPGGFLVRG